VEFIDDNELATIWNTERQSNNIYWGYRPKYGKHGAGKLIIEPQAFKI
jgi:hypothetical protein